MEDTLISFKTAKVAKEKGFDWDVLYHYWIEEEVILKPNSFTCRGIDIFTNCGAIKTSVDDLLDNYDVEGNPDIFKAAPTQSLLQKWLRDIHKLHISIDYTDEDYGFELTITNMINNEELVYCANINYEEVLEEGLCQALDLIPKLQSIKDDLIDMMNKECKHLDKNNNSTFRYTGHNHNDDIYECTLCGETEYR